MQNQNDEIRTRNSVHGRNMRFAVSACMTMIVVAGCQHFRSENQQSSLSPPKIRGRDVKPSLSQQADLQVSMGKLFEQQGDFDRAMVAYRFSLQQDPRRSDAYLRLAILHDRRGEFVKSEELYRQAIENSPGNPDIFCCVGYSYYVQQRWQEAEINLRQAIAINSNHRRSHNNLGMVLARTDRSDEAFEQFRLAGCDHVDSLMNMAFAKTLDGHWDDARHNYQLALAHDPASDDVKKALNNLDGTMARLQDRIDRTAAIAEPLTESATIVSRPPQLQRPTVNVASDPIQLTAHAESTDTTPSQDGSTSRQPADSELDDLELEELDGLELEESDPSANDDVIGAILFPDGEEAWTTADDDLLSIQHQ